MFNIFNRRKKEEEPKPRTHVTAFTDYCIAEFNKQRKREEQRKKFLLRHPETEHIIHTLDCISGSVKGINRAVESLSKNLSKLDKMICELSELAELSDF